MKKIICISLLLSPIISQGQLMGGRYIDTSVVEVAQFGDIGYFHDEVIRGKDSKVTHKHAHLNPQLLATYYPKKDSLVIYSDTMKFIKAVINGKYQLVLSNFYPTLDSKQP